LKISADLSPFNSAEPRENAIDPCERHSRFLRCINSQRRLPLSQEQETQNMVDVGIRQKNGCDWRVAQ